MIMEFKLTNNLSTSLDELFALTFVVLYIANLSVQKCADLKQNKESSVKVVSIIELAKTLMNHNFALLPTIGYLLEKYKGAIKFTVGIYNLAVLGKPSMIQKLYLSTNPGHLHKPTEFEKILTKSLQGNLGMLRADVWKKHRSVLARAFTYNSLKEQVQIFERFAKKLVFLLEESTGVQHETQKISNSSKMQVGQAIASHVLFIILHIVTGKSIVGNHLETTRFCNLVEKIKELMLYRYERPWLFLDICWFLHPKNWELNRTRIELESMFAKVLKTAREEVSIETDFKEDMAGKSLIELMIKAGFSNEEIFKEFIFFVIVSNESIPALTNILLFHLTLHPDLQEKCRLEVCQMFEKLHKCGSTELNIETLNEMQYLEQCIKETVRMYPTLVFQARMLESPLILDEHTTISSGTRVYISAYHLHRNPKYYPEPDKFDPERFSLQNVKEKEKCEYMGFSDGPRNCIGKKSAILEIKVLLSYILYNFEVFTSNTLENFEAEMGPNRWLLVDPKIELRRRS